MLISLPKQATTTPKIRAAIQASDETAWVLAERYGISEQTIWKWRDRDSIHDISHTAHRLQMTLTPAQEAVAVSHRATLLLPLDDLLAVVLEFLNSNVSRRARPLTPPAWGVSAAGPEPEGAAAARAQSFQCLRGLFKP